jgi:hypothetical protein
LGEGHGHSNQKVQRGGESGGAREVKSFKRRRK